MKIKDLIKHLQTLDQDKELIIIGTDPTDWDYGKVIEPEDITLEDIHPNEDNGLEDVLELNKYDEDYNDGEEDEEGNLIETPNVTECYIIRIDC